LVRPDGNSTREFRLQQHRQNIAAAGGNGRGMSLELKTKANIAIGIALAALAGMGWLSLRENRNLAEADQWVAHTHEVLDVSVALHSHLSDAGLARRMFLQGDAKQKDVFNAAVNASMADFSRLRELTRDNPEQQSRLDRLEPVVEARLEILKKSISVYSENPKDDSTQEALTDELIAAAAQFSDQAHEFETVEKELLRQRSMTAEESVLSTSRADTILSFSVFCFIIIATAVLNAEWSRRSRTDETIAKQKSLLQSILDTCNDAILVTDNSGQIILRNPAAVHWYGESWDRLTEDLPARLGFYNPDQLTRFSYQDLPLWRALQGEQVNNVEICVRPPQEEKSRWTLASSRPLIGENAKRLGGVVFYRDISERKELENKLAKYAEDLKKSNVELQKAHVALERLASADELTGLHNRRGFLALADHSLKLARRSQKPFALLFVDVDDLKKINDTFGHTEGNRALSDAAFVLRDSFRHCDVLGRLGGDEFAILMIDAGEESAEVVRNRIEEKLEKLNEKSGRRFLLALSIGVLCGTWDERASLEELLGRADALMYEEKKRKGASRGTGRRAFPGSGVKEQTLPRERIQPGLFDNMLSL
jgi:diguanylate cyclase (GGDEF)-like protein/PAS domain S-box-containing protein